LHFYNISSGTNFEFFTIFAIREMEFF